MNSFYSGNELKKLGFKNYGKDVLLSRKVSVYDAPMISLGNKVRIDDFCILSGKISIGDNTHISAGVYLFGGAAGIIIRDYVSVSSRTAIYAMTDDYSGNAMTNPTIPAKYRNVICGEVELNKHVIVGTGCTILPNVVIGEGTAVGCMSLVSRSLDEWGIYSGIPCHRIKDREKRLLELADEYVANMENNQL